MRRGIDMNWQEIAEKQALIIEELTELSTEIIFQLSQYKNIEQEEERLKGINKDNSEEVRQCSRS